MIRLPVRLFLLLLLLTPNVRGLHAQDSNILHPIAEIERKLRYEPFEIFRIRGLRWEDDLTKRAILKWLDGSYIQVKWKRAPAGGSANNNEPRYEIAAYELQKLFLEPQEYVVPPTVGRCLPVQQYAQIEVGVQPTFDNTSSVYFVMQYWLEKVSSDEIYDKGRFKRDSTYARHLANLNILTYLIDHKDSNVGNFLISSDPENPRVFVVDNSLAFESPESTRGTYWRKLHVDRAPAESVERLRALDLPKLEAGLGVVEQFELRNGQLTPVEPTEPLDRGKGVRFDGAVLQLGLTEYEISKVYERIQNLLEKVDSGKITLF